MSKISPEISYSPKEAVHSSLRMSRVLPLGNLNETLNSSSVTQSLFEVPAKCFNPAKSTLEFQLQALESSTTSVINRLHTIGTSMIDSISLYTRSGTKLAEIENCAEYTKVKLPVITKLQDFLNNDTSLGGATAAAALTGDRGFNFGPSDAAASATPGVANGVNGARVSAAGAAEANSKSYTDISAFVQGVARDGSNAGQLDVSYEIPMSVFDETILAYNKSVFFDQSLQLRINWAPTNKIGFGSTSATNLATGAQNLDTAVTINNIRFNQAVEVSPSVVEALVNKVRSGGLKLSIPYVHSYNFVSASGTSVNFQYRLNRGFGQRLKHVVVALYNNTSTGRLAFDVNNVGDAKISEYRTFIDNVQLTENPIDCSSCEEYGHLKHLFEGNVIQSADMLKANMVHLDSWMAGKCVDWPANNDVADGLPLDNERIYAYRSTVASGSYRLYGWFCVQRELTIGQGMIVVD